jgi:hypothetical protein
MFWIASPGTFRPLFYLIEKRRLVFFVVYWVKYSKEVWCKTLFATAAAAAAATAGRLVFYNQEKEEEREGKKEKEGGGGGARR